MTEADKMILVQPTIHLVASRLCNRFPFMDKDELIGAAQAQALKAVRTHKGDMSELTTWTYRHVNMYYYSHFRRGKWRRRHAKKAVYPQRELTRRKSFDLGGFLALLSKEAVQVVNLALGGDGSVHSLMQDLYSLKWERREIMKVFKEIKDAL